MAGVLDSLSKMGQSSDKALASLQKLGGQLGKAKDLLHVYELQLKKANEAGDVAAHNRLTAAIGHQGGVVDSLAEQFHGLRASQTDATGSTASFGEGLATFASGAVGMTVLAVLALGAALAAVSVKLTMFALAQADAFRSTMLMLQGATGSAKGAEAAEGAISRVAASSALAKSQIEEFARTLAVAGLSGKLFENTLSSLAIVASVAGGAAASKLEGIVEKTKALGHFEIKTQQLKGLGISLEDLAKKMGKTVEQMKADMKAGKISTEQGLDAMNKAIKSRFGDVAGKQALGFGAQMMKLQENIAGLFKGVEIEGFLKALQSVLSVFDQNTASGKAMKLVITNAFTAIFNAVALAAPFVKAFLQGMVIGGLLVYLAFLKIKKALTEAFGGGQVDKALLLKIAMYAGAAAAIIMVVGVLALVAALAMLAAVAIGTLVLLSLPFLIPIALIALLINAIMDIGKGFDGLGDQASSAGSQLVAGFVEGISGMAGQVIAAVSRIASLAKDTLASVLQIHSPSRVGKAGGGFFSQGVAEGVEDGGPDVQKAMAKVVEPPDPKAGRAPKLARGGHGALLHIENLQLIGESARDIWNELEPRIVALLEKADNSGPDPTPA